jgi:P27 family predicted phage terminase small subunit
MSLPPPPDPTPSRRVKSTRGRPPKPTVLHKIEGTARPHRHDIRMAEPQAEGDLAHKPAPEWLTDSQRELWADLLLDAPRDLLKRIDWSVFANYIEVVDRHARLVQAQQKLDQDQSLPFLVKSKHGPMLSPYLRAINHCVLLMIRMQGEMGFTPAARARLVTAPPEREGDDAANPWNVLRSLRVVQGGKK